LFAAIDSNPATDFSILGFGIEELESRFGAKLFLVGCERTVLFLEKHGYSDLVAPLTRYKYLEVFNLYPLAFTCFWNQDRADIGLCCCVLVNAQTRKLMYISSKRTVYRHRCTAAQFGI